MLSRLIGCLLRGKRAGEQKLAWYHPAVAGAPESLLLCSPAFADGETIPTLYAGKGVGNNRSPALTWQGIPEGTRELLLIVEDADAPLPRPFVHLIASSIDPKRSAVPEGALETPEDAVALLGRNSFGKTVYAGPRALPGHGPHRYSFQLLALSRALRFDAPPKLTEVLAALDGAVLARGRLDGIFERH